MHPELAPNTDDLRTPPTADARRSRPPARERRGVAGARRSSRAAGFALVAALLAGCATSNYDFDALSEAGARPRVAQLSDDLAEETAGGEDRALYDVSMIPLVRTHLNVFAEDEGAEASPGFVAAKVDAFLPLFGFVDATVDRYDDARRRYEHHEYSSYLWGLVQTHREQVDSAVGPLETITRRFLWIFSWSSSPDEAVSWEDGSSV